MPAATEPQWAAQAIETKLKGASAAEKAMARFANVSMAMVIIDLVDHRILAANSAAGVMFAESPEFLIGRLELDFVADSDRVAILQAHADLREGRLDGYQALRTFLPTKGTPFVAEAWVRLLSGAVGTTTALLAISFDNHQRDPVSGAGVIKAGAQAFLMATTDHDWLVERASSDSSVVLGIPSRDFMGSPLLGIVHPADMPNFLFAVDRVRASGRAVVCRLRLRTTDHKWRDTVSFVSLLCEHEPPRLGIMAVASDQAELPAEPQETELGERLQRIAAEIRAVEALVHVPEVLGQTSPEEMATLTSRQWEIITLLRRGESAKKIAAALFVSPSTVRNQLSALYRHFGVHSQVELLSRFPGRPGPYRAEDGLEPRTSDNRLTDVTIVP